MKDPKSSRKQNKVINVDYVNNICIKLFELRQSSKDGKIDLSSRTKFKILDIKDAYDKDWVHSVNAYKSRYSESDGFKQIYVPKD